MTRRLWPAGLTFLLAAAYVVYRLGTVGWAPALLSEPGTRYSASAVGGSEGYDGQFTLYMAQDPDPASVAPHLDVPAYRYQRILLPAAARLLGLGQPRLIPWAIILINLLAHTAGTAAVCMLLASRERWVGFGLLYGLWVGVLVGIGTDLHEPLAYALVAWSFWLRSQDKHRLAVAILIPAMLAKETTLVFAAAFFIADMFDHRVRTTAPWYAALGAAFAIWQGWLWWTFGHPGVGSGGDLATSFEWIPFMGLWRVGAYSMPLLAVYLLLFGPGVVFPALWAVWRSVVDIWRRTSALGTWPLLLNGLLIMVTPFSTFREPLGLVRLATGLVLSIVVVAAVRGLRRPLVYGWFWLAYLVLAR